jgi:2-dehydro-3-deoxyphosphooctonate aldolase (KDO 8-P synthase)
MIKKIAIQNFTIGPGSPLAVMCGPCVIEGEDFLLRSAERLKSTFEKTGCNLIFKSSYDKANRSAKDSFRGPGLQEGLRMLERVKKEFSLAIVTDVHSPQEAKAAAEVCDILQIPAFLCRQTDLVMAAAETGCVVSIKKGQFLAPWDMRQVVDKVLFCGNEKVILVERGASFGYNNLVSDMRSIPIMQSFGYPVCFDATHSVQLPGSLGGVTGGNREFIPTLAKAAVAAGADCLFMEAHPNPKEAKSDAASQLCFDELLPLLMQLEKLYDVVQNEFSVSC